jgi:hypothetical protein
VYAREIDGQEFSFGVSGKLIRNVLVMYDRQTESYWSQLLGESVAGEMVGTKLEFLPSWMTTWEQWKELHPETVALDKGGRRGGRDSYGSYYASDRAGVIGKTNFDDRLYTKEFVIGVELEDTAVAYPFSVLNTQSSINDKVGDRELLVTFDKNSGTGMVFDRAVGGNILTFSPVSEDLIVTDEETGSTWDVFSGQAIDGPLAGEQLDRVKSTTVFWFGWADFHPETLIYGIE